MKITTTNFTSAKSVRKVKLHRKWRQLQRSWPNGKNVPWLNISGVWLEKAGFNAGDAVEITVQENTLIIKNCSINGNKRY